MSQEHAGVKDELYGDADGEMFEQFGGEALAGTTEPTERDDAGLTDTKQPPSSFPAGTSLAPPTPDGTPTSMVD